MRLKNKVCVITGGTSGIGRATVFEFLEEGARVLFCAPEKNADADMMNEIEKNFPGMARYYSCDISKENEVKSMAEFVKAALGNCEVLFNNAGVHQTGKIHETSPDDWDRIMNVDVRGVYLCNYYFVPQMLEKNKGVIINMSSVSGLLGDTDMVAYNTAKGAITNMTRCMALDYASSGIRVNAICPGAIRTNIVNHTFESVSGAEEKFVNAYPVKYIPKPKEVAKLAVFLAANECDFLTGVNIPIDGGITAHTGQPYMGSY